MSFRRRKNLIMNNKIKFIFESKMYLISIIPLLFLIFIDNVAHYGYNKSVGWAFEINGISYYSINFFISFIIGFSFLAFIKAKTNFILSFLFFLSFVFFLFDTRRQHTNSFYR